MTLSGGALALSIAFVHDIAPNPQSTCLLVASWIFLVISLGSITASFIASNIALRVALDEVDRGEAGRNPGGRAASVTLALNIVAGSALFLGAVLLMVFAVQNLEGR